MVAVITVLLLLFFLPLLGILFGGFSGWIVGLFFHDTVMGFLSAIGVDVTNLTMWQVGAALGFIGGFFKSNLTQQK